MSKIQTLNQNNQSKPETLNSMAKRKCLKLKRINFYNRETHLLLYPLAKDKIVPQSTLLNIHENSRVH